MTDPIADMLTRIRNANQNRAAYVVIPTSFIVGFTNLISLHQVFDLCMLIL